ncbi:MAG: hypothetical protein HYZ75_00650 [Elusimicrobia bacterium]|nr:hypothetical protein [Elusimicrobiota bacterium]
MSSCAPPPRSKPFASRSAGGTVSSAGWRATRPRDWLDIEGVIVRQSGKLDWPYIMSQLEPLAELER